MTARPAVYSVDKRFKKNGIEATTCVDSVELRCTNVPPLPAECAGPEWHAVLNFVPLAHGTARICVFHQSLDAWVALEDIKALAHRPSESTHVVTLGLFRMRMQPVQTGDTVVFIPTMVMEMRETQFFFAELRDKGTPQAHLALFVPSSEDKAT